MSNPHTRNDVDTTDNVANGAAEYVPNFMASNTGTETGTARRTPLSSTLMSPPLPASLTTLLLASLLLASLIGATTMWTAAPTAQAQSSQLGSSSPVINQGDALVFGDRMLGASSCTIAHVSPGKLITSAHCGAVGTSVSTARGVVVGRVTAHYANNQWDTGIVTLNDNARAGSNRYSGDRIASMPETEIGDSLCQFGAVTGRVLCSPMRSAHHGNFWNDNDVTNGDSGGPGWIPGKGLLGVIAVKYSGGGTVIAEVRDGAAADSIDAPISALTGPYPTGAAMVDLPRSTTATDPGPQVEPAGSALPLGSSFPLGSGSSDLVSRTH